MAFKVSVLTTETQIIVELKAQDQIDKTAVEALKGCGTAKLEVNGVIKIIVERPNRPLRADLNLNDATAEDAQ